MVNETLEGQNRKGWVKSLVIVWTLSLLLLFLAFVLGGIVFSVTAGFAGIASWFITPKVTPAMVLRFYRGTPLAPHRLPHLHVLLEDLSRRAGLDKPPELWLLPSLKPIAFATGDPKHSAVAFSDGILQKLSPHELAGVLAHEISHIAHHDNRIMWFTAVTVKMIHLLSIFGQLMVLVLLPTIFKGDREISLLLLTGVILAPVVATLLQLALLRTREFAADLGSARILGSAAPLMGALQKLDGRFEGMLGFGARRHQQKGHTLFRTHPPVRERVKKLMTLSHMGTQQMGLMPEENDSKKGPYIPGAIYEKKRGDDSEK
ncbi:MAG: zinc metalloprotease HtpX [Desulfobacterales bacterium]|nr:zinc metalloprotease HtpX [Desulfobacterales bacterium]